MTRRQKPRSKREEQEAEVIPFKPAEDKQSSLLVKTRLCTFYMQGLCRFGTECTFAHTPGEVRKLPDLTKTKPCKAFLEGKCNDSNCNFAHSQSEIRSICKLMKYNRNSSERNSVKMSQDSSKRPPRTSVEMNLQRPPFPLEPLTAPFMETPASLLMEPHAAPRFWSLEQQGEEMPLALQSRRDHRQHSTTQWEHDWPIHKNNGIGHYRSPDGYMSNASTTSTLGGSSAAPAKVDIEPSLLQMPLAHQAFEPHQDSQMDPEFLHQLLALVDSRDRQHQEHFEASSGERSADVSLSSNESVQSPCRGQPPATLPSFVILSL